MRALLLGCSLLVFCSSCDGALNLKFVDEKRNGEVPLEDASAKTLLEHAHLQTQEARLNKAFENDVIAVVPFNTDPWQITASQDAILRYNKKLDVVVGNYLKVKKRDDKKKPFVVEGVSTKDDKAFNKSFVRNLQAKNVKVASFVRFDHKGFKDHEAVKAALKAPNGVTDLIEQLVPKVKKLQVDGIFLDIPNFEWNDLEVKNALTVLLKKLTKKLSSIQAEDDDAHIIGLLARNHGSDMGYNEFLTFQEYLDYIIVGHRLKPFAEKVFPNPSLTEVKAQLQSICRTCGEKKMKKDYKNKIAFSIDLAGYLKQGSMMAARMNMAQFRNSLELGARTDECFGDKSHPIVVDWDPTRDEFEYRITPRLVHAPPASEFPGKEPFDDCKVPQGEAEERFSVVVPTLKSFKSHLNNLIKLKSAVALWNLGLGHSYLMEVL